LSTLDKLSALQGIELQHRPLLSKLPHPKKSPVNWDMGG